MVIGGGGVGACGGEGDAVPDLDLGDLPGEASAGGACVEVLADLESPGRAGCGLRVTAVGDVHVVDVEAHHGGAGVVGGGQVAPGCRR